MLPATPREEGAGIVRILQMGPSEAQRSPLTGWRSDDSNSDYYVSSAYCVWGALGSAEDNVTQRSVPGCVRTSHHTSGTWTLPSNLMFTLCDDKETEAPSGWVLLSKSQGLYVTEPCFNPVLCTLLSQCTAGTGA